MFLDRGMLNYYQGVLYTLLGEKEKAVEHLNLAVQKGMQFSMNSFFYDHHLLPLKDYPPFSGVSKT